LKYRKIRVLSGKGSSPGRFSETLRGIAVDRAGLIHAVGDCEVKVFDVKGKLQRRYRTTRPGVCIAVDRDGTTHVGQAGQVEKFDCSGKKLPPWRDADRMGLVTAMGFLPESILLADAQDRCIRRFDRKMVWLNDIGKDNNTRGFLIPNGHLDFQVDPEGIIHATNPAKFRVEKYTLEGKMVGRFGHFGVHRPENFPGCCNPTNIALTREGNIVVTEKAGPRMKVFDPDGKMLALVGSDAFDAGCKNMDVAVDAQGRIFVVDTVRLHICVFAREKPEKTEDRK